MTIDPSQVGFDNLRCYHAVYALAKKICTSHQVVDEMVLENVNGMKCTVNEGNALDVIIGSQSRVITVYVKDDPTFQAKLKKIAGKAAAGVGDAVAKKVYTYTADGIAQCSSTWLTCRNRRPCRLLGLGVLGRRKRICNDRSGKVIFGSLNRRICHSKPVWPHRRSCVCQRSCEWENDSTSIG